MLYYLMLVPAVLSTAVIYFLSPALSYWWLLPVLLGCFVAANLVYVLLMFVCSLFAGPNRMYDRISPFYLALTLALDGWILALCRIKIHVEGLEKVPTDSEFLFVSNHRSNFDPMVQWWVLRRWPLAFVSKPSNMRKFVIGPFVRRCCFLPIDRENARNALTTINAAANLIRAHVCSFAIYPEGTRSKSGQAAAVARRLAQDRAEGRRPHRGRHGRGHGAHRAQRPLAALARVCAHPRGHPRRDGQGHHDQRAHGGCLRQNARRAGKVKNAAPNTRPQKRAGVFLFHWVHNERNAHEIFTHVKLFDTFLPKALKMPEMHRIMQLCPGSHPGHDPTEIPE